MNNPIVIENNLEEQNYFSKDNLLKNFLSISVIYISIISLASYFVFSNIISYSLFVFSVVILIIRTLFIKNKISYDAASLTTILLILFCLVPICAYYSGGIFSPILWWYIIVPIVSLLLFGRCAKTATVSALSIVCILIFALLNHFKYNLPAYDNTRIHFGVLISLIGLLCLAYTITWIFESQKSFAYKKLVEEKERLKISESSFRDIFENTDDLIQNISFKDGKFAMVNPTWLNTLGYTAKEAEQLQLEDILDSSNNESSSIILTRLKKEKNIDNLKLIFKTKDGEKVYVEGLTGVVYNDDIPVSIRGIFRNVSFKRKAEVNELKNRLALEQAQELAQIGSWEINLISNTPTWSKEMYRIFEIQNYNTGASLDNEFKNSISIKDNESFKNLVITVFKTDQIGSTEFIIVNKKGETKYINVIAEPLKSESSKTIIGVKGTAQDVTKQKLAVLAKSNFLRTMSHEIRTPINGVFGIANLLKSENLTNLQKDYVDTLHLSSQHLLSIVTEILDFSKMESGHFEFDKVPFNIYELCKNIFDEHEQKAIKNNLQLNFIPASNHTINVLGDKERLSQVLSNLISNAIKFTQEGHIDFIYTIEESYNKVEIKFTIKDTGIGISENSQSSIFDIFSQVDDSTTRKYGGTGLGLAISKRLIDLQNGKLYLTSELNVGSTFFVDISFEKLPPTVAQTPVEIEENKIETLLPIEKEHEVQKEIVQEEPKPIAKKLDGMRILVAEDNAVNAMVLTRFLTKWGITYDVAKNGQLAIDKLETTGYDLILMDLHMPVLGGREATKIIRNSNNNYKGIPIIALTADAILDSQRDLIDEGFNQCILKPFNPDALFNALAVYHN
jgi:PAS domain S-box-containing protein